MKEFDIDGLSQYPWLRPAIKAAAAIAVLGAVAGAWATSGPGNWARLERQVIVLPTMVVVSKREAANQELEADRVTPADVTPLVETADPRR